MIPIALIALSAIALAMVASFDPRYRVSDAQLQTSLALPDGAATVTSVGIDTGAGSKQAYIPGHFELIISAPPLNTTQLPDATAITYSIVSGANADLTATTVIIPGALIQTGAGGVGAAAVSIAVRLPPETQRYVGLQAVKSGSGDASSAIASLKANF